MFDTHFSAPMNVRAFKNEIGQVYCGKERKEIKANSETEIYFCHVPCFLFFFSFSHSIINIGKFRGEIVSKISLLLLRVILCEREPKENQSLPGHPFLYSYLTLC